MTFWTDKRMAELKRLAKEGLSGSQIGRRLGCSRCAAIAKAWRLKQPLKGVAEYPAARPKRAPQSPRGKPVPQTRRPKPHKPACLPEIKGPLVRTPTAASCQPVSILELAPSSCRWPLNTWRLGCGHTVRFCGDAREDGEAYCRRHKKLSIVPHKSAGPRMLAAEKAVASR